MLESCSSDKGEEQSSLKGALATKQRNAGLVRQSEPQKQLAEKSQCRRTLSFAEQRYC